MAQREYWGSKLGVILAVAGSAIGLGNFLRFPVKAATYGGGAFLIPYLIAFVLLGIPLAWVEWTMGRYGGRYSHGSAPGILDVVVRKPWAKYVGSLGILGPLLIYFYYVYIESWLLGFAFYALNGELLNAVETNTITVFFGNYITLQTTLFANIPAALVFFLVTFILNFAIIGFGIRRGIEVANKFALPLIFILGIVLLIRVLTIPDIDRGLAFMWNPDFSSLLKPKVWLEASGQIFFTLSVGIGVILTYASYVHRNQDVALSSLSSCAANGFAEVIIGGTIVIPMAIVLFGVDNVEQVAKVGTFGLGFNTMPMLLGKIPLSSLLQFIWFMLLFFAGITSSMSIIQPSISFLEDELSWKRSRAVAVTALLSFIMCLIGVFGLSGGAIDELDFWGGTFALVIFGTIEAVLFAWVLGIDKGWDELNRGAHIRLPVIFKYILKYVTPVYLLVILTAWFITDGWGFITLKGIDPSEQVNFLGVTLSKTVFIAAFRILLLMLLFGINLVIYLAWKKNKNENKSTVNNLEKETVHA
ncbi:MAG: sodium-dependent transporter [Fibrobacter sp.]|jgi:SNF family Na+-dependent transporter|nr:sodium-dependent transporter [Fibrobacter sp.]HON11359.1 sodium-dependent transporter [Chitinispirillaceae bacterium]